MLKIDGFQIHDENHDICSVNYSSFRIFFIWCINIQILVVIGLFCKKITVLNEHFMCMIICNKCYSFMFMFIHEIRNWRKRKNNAWLDCMQWCDSKCVIIVRVCLSNINQSKERVIVWRVLLSIFNHYNKILQKLNIQRLLNTQHFLYWLTL